MPEEPTREGYTFADWGFDFTAPIIQPTTVTPTWTINQYTLTIVYGNGQEDTVITQDYNTAIESITEPEREGYTLTWDKAIPSVMPAENTTVTANWEAIFTLTGGVINGLTEHGQTLAEIVIPANIDGVDITAVGSYAFRNNQLVKGVRIEEGVTEIKDYAFENCTVLETVYIPNSVTKIENNAFSGCSNIQYTEKDSLQYLGNDTNPYLYLAGVTDSKIQTATIEDTCKFIGKRAFYDCKELTAVTIPDGVTSIGVGAFSGCALLSEVELPQSITEIANETFFHCTNLAEITVPSGVTAIGGGAFSGCTGLLEIVLPESVKKISSQAFYNCTGLQSAQAKGVESIEDWAFAFCSNLQELVLSEAVYVFGWAFSGCSNLTTVFYMGTAESWTQNVTLGMANESVSDATRYYYVENEEDVPTDGGKYWHYVDGVPTAW